MSCCCEPSEPRFGLVLRKHLTALNRFVRYDYIYYDTSRCAATGLEEGVPKLGERWKKGSPAQMPAHPCRPRQHRQFQTTRISSAQSIESISLSLSLSFPTAQALVDRVTRDLKHRPGPGKDEKECLERLEGFCSQPGTPQPQARRRVKFVPPRCSFLAGHGANVRSVLYVPKSNHCPE